MRVATAPLVADLPRPWIRLRTILLVGALLGAGWWVKPRVIAAWQLHQLANTYADYGACMVGPTGPSLLRDNPSGFAELLRRKLVSEQPTSRPFAGCRALAQKAGASEDMLLAHELPAEEFSEYGGIAADIARTSHQGVTLERLGLRTERLADLAREAWPFVRSGYTRLMKPTSHAKEAIHPVETSQPGMGSGLPARRDRYRSVARRKDGRLQAALGSGANLEALESTDGGISWRPTRSSSVDDLADRCLVDQRGRSFAFSMDAKTDHWVVMSLGPDSAPYAADLAPSSVAVAGASCDRRALVVALVPNADATEDEQRRVELRLCPFRQPCTKMPLPDLGQRGAVYPVDVARVNGTTVLSISAHGLTRVSSTRDEGRSWSPLVLAFDAEARRSEAVLRTPWRLLPVEGKLFLYGGGKRENEAYWLLVSDDQGASFRAP